MRKIMKRLLSFSVALVMVLSMLPASAAKASAETSTSPLDYLTAELGYATYGNAPTVTYVAKIGQKGYETLQAAFDAVGEGETIDLMSDITITADNLGYTDGQWNDGVRYTGDKSFTVDFRSHTVTDDGCINDYLIYLNNKGEKANTVTFTNGTLVLKNGAHATVTVGASTSTYATTLNLDGMNITNSNAADYSGNQAVRARDKSTVNVKSGSVITSDGAAYAVACTTGDSVLNINSGAKIVQKNSGVSSGNNTYAAVGGKGIINIYDGAEIVADAYGVHTMTTGTPVVSVYGGTITANVALKASTNGGEGQLATINVYGGTINGGLEEYTNNGAILVQGGTFSEEVSEEYCAEGYIPTATVVDGETIYGVKTGSYTVRSHISGVGYETLADALANAADGDELVLLSDIPLSKTLELKDKAITLTINGNGHKIYPAPDAAALNTVIFLLDQGSNAESYTVKNIVFEGWSTNHIIRIQGIDTAEVSGCTIQNCVMITDSTASLAAISSTDSNVTITGNTITGNTCRKAIDINSWGSDSVRTAVISNNTITHNICVDTSVIFYNAGNGCEVTGNTITDNKVTAAGNGATVYLRRGANCTVTNNTITRNTVTCTGGSTERAAGALVAASGTTVTGNVLGGNTVTAQAGTVAQVVTKDSSGNSNPIDLSANYWGGDAPAAGDIGCTDGVDWRVESYYQDADHTELVALNYIAQVGGVKYQFLQEAVDAAAAIGGTVELLSNVTLPAGENIKVLSGEVTVNGNGCTIEGDDGFWVEGGKLTLSADLTVIANVYNAIYIRGGEVITYANLTANGEYAAIQGNGNYAGDVTIKGGTITAVGTAIYWPQNGVLTIDDGAISGTVGIEIRAGQLIVNGGTINASETFTEPVANGSGTTVESGAAIVLSQHTTQKATTVTITGGTLNGAYAFYQCNTTGTASSSITATIDSDVVLNGTVADVKIAEVGFKMPQAENGGYALEVVENAASYMEINGEYMYFESVYAAGAYADANDVAGTIVLFKDCDEFLVGVPAGVSLDLNGHTLKVSMLVAHGAIIDSTNSTGLLQVAQGSVVLSQQGDSMPVWNGTNGYFFRTGCADLTTNAIVRKYTEDETLLELVFLPLFSEEMTQLMVDGSTDNSLTLTVRVQWNGVNGPVSQDFTYKDEWFDDVYTNGSAFNLIITNYTKLEGLTYTVLLISDIGAEFAGASGSYSLS